MMTCCLILVDIDIMIGDTKIFEVRGNTNINADRNKNSIYLKADRYSIRYICTHCASGKNEALLRGHSCRHTLQLSIALLQ